MAIRSDDITQIIKSAIDEFDAGAETRSVGTVVEVGDGIARIYGLDVEHVEAFAADFAEIGDYFDMPISKYSTGPFYRYRIFPSIT